MNKLLGDFIADMAEAIGVKPCGKCKKRQAKLNAWDQKRRDKKAKKRHG